MAKMLLTNPGVAMAKAGKRLEEEERGKGPAEHWAAHRDDADVAAWAPEPRAKDFAMAERMIEALDARRVSAGREMAGESLLQNTGEESFVADSEVRDAPDGEQNANVNNASEAWEESPPIGQQIATPTINLIPSDPTRVTVTKTTRVMQARPKAAETKGRAARTGAAGAAGMPEPSAYDLSNLIEEFSSEDEQVGVSEASEPWASDHAGTMLPQSSPMNRQVKRANQDCRTIALSEEASEDLPSLDKAGKTESVPIGNLRPNRLQPRRRFDEEGIRALADSMEKNGVLQPILVRRHPDRRSEFEIVAGERRYRAAKLAQIHTVPVVIREISDCQALEFALVENIQRQDLTPLEKADGYHRLIQEFNNTQEDLARVLCKSRSHVANTLRLLNLSPAIKEMLQQGELSAGHARALLSAEQPEELARRIVTDGLSVRQTEIFAQTTKANGSASHAAKSAKSSEIAILERNLAALLGLKVTIATHGRGGTLTVRFTSPEQLEDILRRLSPAERAPEWHPIPDGKSAQQSEPIGDYRRNPE